ncbi:MAG: DUF1499 domain-containing protein [Sphingomonas sp.]|nr:DUF1499 domain-containing protein [Sphingomonas sp.]
MRKFVVRLALLVSLLIPVYFAVAALGAKFGFWDWRFGLGTLMVEWGPRILIGSLVLGAVALLAALTSRPRRGAAVAVLALVIPAVGLAYGYHIRSSSADIPPIHDVSTNAEDPPQYSPRVMRMRTATGANPVHPPTTPLGSIEAYQSPRFADQSSRTVAELGREAYPELRTLAVRADRPRLFDVLLEEARKRGWKIHTSDPAGGFFEATAETFWFGFKDDVAVQVQPARVPGTLLVDARSTSRVGLGDMGTNAARLTDYLQAVEVRLREAG